MSTVFYIGPPGTGKTTKLVSIVADRVKAGTDIGRIGYVSFTRAAVDEAARRVGQTAGELEYFRTLHSLCFRLRGLSSSMVMGREHYLDLGQRLGVEMTGGARDKASLEELADGDKALGVVDLARARQEPLREVWERTDTETGIDWLLVDLVDRGLRRYKQLNFLVDFTDMLEGYLKESRVPSLDLLVVDEAQDLSRLQWRVLEKLRGDCADVILAGDDDQAIYHWAGVEAKDMLREVGAADHAETLSKSWRLPRSVHRLASEISGRIVGRLPKTFSPRDEEGAVEHLSSLEEAGLATGRWLALVRNRYLAGQVVDRCLREGWLYEHGSDSPRNWRSVKAARAWEDLRKGRQVAVEEIADVVKMLERPGDKIKLALLLGRKDGRAGMADLMTCGIADSRPWFEALSRIPQAEAEYIRAALRGGEKLREPPRIRIGTIHGAKGAEEDNVLLLTDQSYRTWRGADRNPDDEARVFYVGVTRARQRLAIVQPQTQYAFDL